MAKYSNDNWRDFNCISKTLADESRIRILAMLELSELCVCQIVKILKLAPSTVSKHLSILSAAALIRGRKKGKWVYYGIAKGEKPANRNALRYVMTAIEDTSQYLELKREVIDILKEDTDKLCRRVYGDGKAIDRRFR